jgi:hypothetical protein
MHWHPQEILSSMAVESLSYDCTALGFNILKCGMSLSWKSNISDGQHMELTLKIMLDFLVGQV